MALENDELNQRRAERREEQRFLAKQQKFLRLGILITALTMIFCVGALLVARGMIAVPGTTAPETTEPATTLPPETPVPPTTVPDTVIHFVAGGDINVTDKTVTAGTAVSGYDFTNTFMDLVPVLAGADLTAVNFEGSLYGNPYGSLNASAPPQLMTALRNAGVDLLQAANSYSVKNGLSGLRATQQGIRAAGMEPVGAYEDSAAAQKSGGYYIREVQGIRIAFVAFTKGMDGAGLPAGSEGCVNLLYTDYNSTYQKVDTAGIKAVLENVRKAKPDITIALLHWGSEFNNQVSATQEKIRDLLLENGVSAIIGTHSHYVQQIDFDAEAGTLVAYSLGDLLGDGTRSGTESSILLDKEITKDGTTGQVKITGFDYPPIFIADEPESGGQLRLLRIREAIEGFESKYIGSVSKETYEAMKFALSRIESRIKVK